MNDERVLLNDFIHPDYIRDEHQYSCTYRYIGRYVNECVFLEMSNPISQSVRADRTIWSLWWQGEQQMPLLVQRCIESVRENKPEGYDYVLITKDNINEYVFLPDYIWDKHNQGLITTTHLSDIIRMDLLGRHGGCWIDATIFCSDKIPEYLLCNELFFYRSSRMDKPVHKGSSWWINAKAQNRLIQGVRNALLMYWEQEKELVDYYLLHAFIARLMDDDKECGGMLRKMPYFNNSNTHSLWAKLDAPFDEKEWEWIKDSSVVHKLSYKQKHILGDLKTFYMALINREL